MPPFPTFLESAKSILQLPVFLASFITFLLAVFASYWRFRTLTAKQAKAKEQVEQLQKSYEEWVSSKVEGLKWGNLLGQVVSTSTAQAPVGIAEGNAAIDDLREQISVIEQKIQSHRNEIVEVSKIDPVLEATLKASIENLTKRIEFLEKSRLEKWDMAIIVFQVLGGIGTIFGIVLAIIKYLHP